MLCYIYMDTHMYINTSMYTYLYTRTHRHTHARINLVPPTPDIAHQALTYIHRYDTYIHRYDKYHKYMYIYIYTHTHTHKHTNTLTHTPTHLVPRNSDIALLNRPALRAATRRPPVCV